MEKLAICGDSWMAPTLGAPGTHFSELLAKWYGCELVALSRGGCSNAAICLQIEQAISMDVDFVIIGATTPDRIEIPFSKHRSQKVPKNSKRWQEFLDINESESPAYDKKKGLANISYARHPDLSALNDFLQDPALISESINNLIYSEDKINDFYDLDPNVIKSLKSYVANLYDGNFKRQIDCWIVNNMLKRLKHETDIKFLFFPHLLFTKGYTKELAWLDTKHIAAIKGPYGLERSDAVRYHTTKEAQITVKNDLIIKIGQILNV